MNPKLKVVSTNKFKDTSISEIIGRDASPKLKLTPPVFEHEPIDMWNHGIKWMGIQLFTKGWER